MPRPTSPARDAAARPLRQPAARPSRAPDEVDALVLAHLPLVGHCVGEVMSRVPGHVDRDDLAGAGVEGLLQAARSWDDTCGVPFTAHARTRIRGAVVDELRATDWASRGARSRARHAAETTEHLSAVLARTPTADELADALGVAADHVHQVRAETHRSYLTSLEESHPSGDGALTVHDTLRDLAPTPEDHVVLAEHLGRLRQAVDLLPDRVRDAVSGHYLDEEPMARIAARLGVTESRVSQLRAEGVSLLQAALAAPDVGTSVVPAPRTAGGSTAGSSTAGGLDARRRTAGGRAAGRAEAYVAAVGNAIDTRTSVTIGSAVLAGSPVPGRAAASG